MARPSSAVNTAREIALAAAVQLHRNGAEAPSSPAFLGLAQDIYRWLVGPAAIHLTFGPIQEQGTGEPTGKNGSAMTQLRDTQQFTLSLAATDAKGQNVPDDPTQTGDDPVWTSSDEDVFTVAADPADPRTATVKAGLPGSAVGTVTIGAVSATFAVDVVPGEIALVSLSEGEITEQA